MEDHYPDIQFALFKHDVLKAIGRRIQSSTIDAVEAWESIAGVRWVSDDGTTVIASNRVAAGLIGEITGTPEFMEQTMECNAGEVQEWVRDAMAKLGWTAYAPGDVIRPKMSPAYIIALSTLIASSLYLIWQTIEWFLR